MLTLLLIACSLRLGRPEIALGSITPGAVLVASSEPGLRDALAESLARGLAARGALARGEGTRVDLEVLDASTSVLAAADGAQVHRARLSLAVQLYGPAPRRVVLSAERSYTLVQSASLEAAGARAEAFEALALELCQDAVDWILLSPGASP